MATPRRILCVSIRLLRQSLDGFNSGSSRNYPNFGELGSMIGWGGKLVGAVARIAALLHMVTHAGNPTPWETLLIVDTVRRAIQIGEYLIPHAHAAYAEMGADPEIEAARYTLALYY